MLHNIILNFYPIVQFFHCARTDSDRWAVLEESGRGPTDHNGGKSKDRNGFGE